MKHNTIGFILMTFCKTVGRMEKAGPFDS